MRGSSPAFTSERARGVLVALALAGLAGCTSAIPNPTVDDAQWAAQRWPGTDVSQLSHGRELYVRKCGGCHSLYEPAQFPESHWPANVDEMVERARLRPDERDLIVHYLQTASRGNPADTALAAHQGGDGVSSGGSRPSP